MQRAKPAVFGKKGITSGTAASMSPHQPQWSAWAFAAVCAVALGAGILAVYPSLAGWPTSATTVGGSAPTFPLTGIWAANGQTCSEASVKLDLDGSIMTSISVLGRVQIGSYSVSGENPLILTFSSGDTVAWDTTSTDILQPISVFPMKDNRLKMMTLTRC